MEDDEKFLVDCFYDEETFNNAIKTDHVQFMDKIHSIIIKRL